MILTNKVYEQTYATDNNITTPAGCGRREVTTIIQTFVRRTTSATNSPALAERPRDASCLSVVSFNRTIRRAPSSIISYFDPLQIYGCIQLNSVLFSSLLFVVVVHAGCDKQDSLMRGGLLIALHQSSIQQP